MREKIVAISKGEIEYELVKLQLSRSELRLVVVAGTEVTESFTIKNVRGTKVKGFLCSEDFSIPFTPVFCGEENTITYTISAKHKVPGESMKGVIHIVTDCGQADLPYHIEVVAPVLRDNQGVINDYYLLKNRICMDYEAGAALFHAPEFKEVFLFRDEAGVLMYEQLVKHNTRLQSMEEFLIAEEKKETVHFKVDGVRPCYEIDSDAEAEYALKLSTQTWGTIGIHIISEDGLVVPGKSMVFSDSFIGGQAVIPFIIKGERLKRGKRSVKLIFESVYDRQEIVITVRRKNENVIFQQKRYEKKCIWAFGKNLLNWKLGNISEQEFAENLKMLLPVFEKGTENVAGFLRDYCIVKISEIQKEEEEKAEAVLSASQMKERPQYGAAESDILEYLVGLAFVAEHCECKDEREKIVAIIRAFYENGYERCEIFYILLQLDSYYQSISAQTVFEEICRYLKNGCRSPLMYLEALKYYQKDLSMIHDLEPVHANIIYFGIKEGVLGKEFTVTLNLLSERIQQFSYIVFSSLTLQYKKYQFDDTLHAICSMLIRCERTGKEYFPWFALGVEKRLRITELFEYYMYSLNREEDIVLSNSILTYFQYENHLSEPLKAFLYCYILKHKEQIPSIYESYRQTIWEFARKKAAAEKINKDLGYIYEQMLGAEEIRNGLVSILPSIMFRHLLICRNSHMKQVVVIYPEVTKEESYPLIDGQTVIDLYTPDAQIYFIDQEGHYYAKSVEYTLEKLTKLDDYAMLCFESGSNDKRLLIHLLSKAMKNYPMKLSQAVLCRLISKMHILRSSWQGKVMYSLYEFAKEHKDEEFLLQVLEELDLSLIKPERRPACIDDCIRKGLFEKAWSGIEILGPEGCDKEQLLLLATWYIKKGDSKCTPFSQKLCYYLYRSHTYNASILEYLLKFYMGRTEPLFQLYEDAIKQEVSIEESMMERILAEVLFVGESPELYEGLCLTYIQSGKNRILAKAVQNYFAYQYLTAKCRISEELFANLKKEAAIRENNLIILAVLKRYSEQRDLTEGELYFIDYQLSRLVKEGIIMKFMKNFSGRIELPFAVLQGILVEHYSNTVLPVNLLIEYGDGVKTVPMRKILPGIFCKEFLLFEGEALSYTIVEEETGKEMPKRRLPAQVGNGEGSFFAMVNEMLHEKDTNPERCKEICQKIKRYKEMARKLFQPF